MGEQVSTVGAPQKQYIYMLKILCHGKFERENSIYDMKRGAHILGTFSPFVLLLDF
jgi:hypothetical protein